MARLADALLAHGEIVDQLARDLARGGGDEAASITLLFAGPSGIGKKLAARALAQILLCDEKSGCGRCGPCLRVEKNQHESFLLVEPDGTQIKIDQARAVLEFLQLRTWTGLRVIVIDQAQTLNIQAANALLKSLEEPPAGTVFILIAPSPSSMLATIRSRSRSVLFRPLSDGELRKLGPAPEWAVRAARGSAEKLARLQDQDEIELRSLAIETLKLFVSDKDFLLNPQWRDAVKDRASAARILGSWPAFLRDALLVQAGAGDLVLNSDQAALIKMLAQLPKAGLEELSQKLLVREAEVAQFRDAQLVMEELWVSSRPSLS